MKALKLLAISCSSNVKSSS